MREVLTGLLEPMAGDIPDVREHEESQAEEEAEEGIRSQWTLAHFCCEQVRPRRRGAWLRRCIQECQHARPRDVRSRKPQRGHRESEQHAWLHTKWTQRAGAVGA